MGDGFRRDRAADGANAMLNYGYTVLRASVARSVMAAGLHPSIGLHHQNRFNDFCLVDDVMEPFRPVIDGCVSALVGEGATDVTPDIKAALVTTLSQELHTDRGIVPVSRAIEWLVQSLATAMMDGGTSLVVAEIRGRLV